MKILHTIDKVISFEAIKVVELSEKEFLHQTYCESRQGPKTFHELSKTFDRIKPFYNQEKLEWLQNNFNPDRFGYIPVEEEIHELRDSKLYIRDGRHRCTVLALKMRDKVLNYSDCPIHAVIIRRIGFRE